MTTRLDVLVVGEANFDHIATADGVPELGGEVPTASCVHQVGGKGVNAARAAARLGARVGFVGRIGDDHAGREILAHLATLGVDCTGVTHSARLPTGSAIVQVDARRTRARGMSDHGANAELAIDPEHLATLEPRVVVVQLSLEDAPVRDTLRHFGERSIPVLVDLAGRDALDAPLLSAITMARGNEDEVESWTGIEVVDADSARRAAAWFLDRGVRAVVVPFGGDGHMVVVSDEGDDEVIEPLELDKCDPIGVGDSTLAALAVARANGRRWVEAARFAATTAALVLARPPDAELPTRTEVEELMKQRAG